MVVTTLAHGGQLTGDEIALIGGGIAFAMLFPVAVLAVAARRARSAQQADEEEPNGGDEDALAAIGVEPALAQVKPPAAPVTSPRDAQTDCV